MENGVAKILIETNSEKNLEGVFVDPLLSFEGQVDYVTLRNQEYLGLL